jgi:ribosomal RNA-processing protein 8
MQQAQEVAESARKRRKKQKCKQKRVDHNQAGNERKRRKSDLSAAAIKEPPSTSALSKAKAQPGLTRLQVEMKRKLSGARFRFINERLYTVDGSEAAKLFKNEPNLFRIYHEGFSSQVEKWPEHPLSLLISRLEGRVGEIMKKIRVADLGCGEAQLAKTLGERASVESFDLVAEDEHVTVCDLASVRIFLS